jgi:hypothetical protein
LQANIPMFLNYTPYVWMKERLNSYKLSIN